YMGRASLLAFASIGWLASLSTVHTSARLRSHEISGELRRGTPQRQRAKAARQGQNAASTAVAPRAVLDQYCVTCHNQKLRTAGVVLDAVDVAKPRDHAELWERVIAKLRAGSMPPPGRPRPDPATYRAVAS